MNPYFIQYAMEMGYLTIFDYLRESKNRFVAIVNGNLLKQNNGFPYVEVEKAFLWDEINSIFKPNDIEEIRIMTEYEYLENTTDFERWKYADGIMDTSNGHNLKLVQLINYLWDKDCEKFYLILTSLYRRDIIEIFNADCFDDLADDIQSAEKNLVKEWDYWAANYLQHIADDNDLEIIICFINPSVLCM